MKFDEPAVRQFLARSMIARIATVSARGTPQIMPLWFAEIDGRLYMTNARTSPTVRNIAVRSNVVVIFESDRGSSHDRYLRLTGPAQFRQDPAIVQRVALRTTRKHYLSLPAILSTVWHIRRLPSLRRYYAERMSGSGVIEVEPHTLEFPPMPMR
jgi:general stress protein 26